MSQLKNYLQIVTEELSSERDLLTVRIHVEVCTQVVELADQLEMGPALHSLSKTNKIFTQIEQRIPEN